MHVRLPCTTRIYPNEKPCRLRAAEEREFRARGTLLATMSHEIRTPLAGVISSLELLSLESDGLNGSQLAYISTSMRCADALVDTINNVLEFSKLEAGHVRLIWSSAARAFVFIACL